MPECFGDTASCAQALIDRQGPHLRVAAPLGLGKPHALLNAIYRQVVDDPAASLTLYTALSLTPPAAGHGLQRRFLAPFLERHFGEDVQVLDYVPAQAADRLPANVRVHEFYLQSGSMLGSAQAQRAYVSQNYTHVARDLVACDINVIVQLVAMRQGEHGRQFSLSSNPDVTLELLERMAEAGQPRPLVIGVVHAELPFMDGGAKVPESMFDWLLEPAHSAPLFAMPREPVDVTEYAIGLHASALVRDGGTLQVGIGALSDAMVHALCLRQRQNTTYGQTLGAIDSDGGTLRLAESLGGLAPFAEGVYGASEMVLDGFMHLRRAGILGRRVYDDLALERSRAAGAIGDVLKAGDAERLRACGALPEVLDANAVDRLVRFGLLPRGARLDTSCVRLADVASLPGALQSAEELAAWDAFLAGRRLRGGRYLRGAFFLGSTDLYAWLRGLEGDEADGVDMTRVSDVNQLYGGQEALDRLQRRDARFFNICMMSTVLGAAVSDGLEDGRVVSGVGGQYNFVAMAHALESGRSVLMMRAARRSRGRWQSNVRFSYGHVTIPRHLRDLVVTEYGVADLRGRCDEDCIKAMLAICDARFVDALAAQCKRAGKLAADFVIPEHWRSNTPEHLARALKPWRENGTLPSFPLGCDFSADEQRLLPALGWLRDNGDHWRGRLTLAAAWLAPGAPVPGEAAALARMQLSAAASVSERVQRRLLQAALRRTAR
ncbi:acetyl-CoA hydrolase/transferase C-terminal domain-containing protein [Oleiagrimonas sp. C23AA]|uniref:acetyl-CoA hydrolase/transferase C-terminal domain-containing protein n=1 Tax=Oleiagrimonas sp. C23AA TaxID=2719047 RepID=UPI001423B9C9|nr:acetyl-CoA hydrolase/transferase C-terminal domain-containing protein [Oleiagrimonas sp. C23AA]NII10538.1 acetyl-CoA hydrolase [Oleiagrimonas sp. C23AA]